MKWRSLAYRVLIPFISLIAARYCARSAVETERYIKNIIPNQKLPDSMSNFGPAYLQQIYDSFEVKGLEAYQKFILYRLPSQILIMSIIYPIIRDIAQYLGRCEMRLDVLSKKKEGRFYPTAHLHALTWPFLLAEILQTLSLLLTVYTFQKNILFFYLATFAGKLAVIKYISLLVLLNGLPVAILVSIARIIMIGWQTGQVFGGFREQNKKVK